MERFSRIGIWGRIRERGSVLGSTVQVYCTADKRVVLQYRCLHFSLWHSPELDSFHYVQADSSPEGCNHICTASCVHVFTIYIQSCSNTYVTFWVIHVSARTLHSMRMSVPSDRGVCHMWSTVKSEPPIFTNYNYVVGEGEAVLSHRFPLQLKSTGSFI